MIIQALLESVYIFIKITFQLKNVWKRVVLYLKKIIIHYSEEFISLVLEEEEENKLSFFLRKSFTRNTVIHFKNDKYK